MEKSGFQKNFEKMTGNHFCRRFMVPCSLSAENIFRFFEVRTYPSIHHFGLDVSPLVMQSRKAGFPLQHELGSGSPAFRVVCKIPLLARRTRQPAGQARRATIGYLVYNLQRYVSRMTRTENFRSQFFFKVFLETTFLHVLWYPVHY